MSASRKPQLMTCLLLLLFSLSALYHIGAGANTNRKYYDTLEISPDADDKTIKKAYKKLALKWHPDRNPDNQEEANAKFAEIAEAYEVLSDPEKKQQYDQFGDAAFSGGGGGGRGGYQTFHFGGDPFSVFDIFFANKHENIFQRQGARSSDGNGFHFEFTTGGGGGRGGGRRREENENIYELDPYVTDLNEDNFEDNSSDYVRIVEFYASWCGHCKELAPKWKNIAKAFRGIIKVGAVNCGSASGLCKKYEVTGYPTIIGFVPGSAPVKFNGQRDTKTLETWALGLLPNKVSEIKEKSLSKFLEKCDGRKKSNEQKVTWWLCMLLFTDKVETSALYKSLALSYEGKIAFGEVKKIPGLNSRFNMTSMPALVAVCNGDIEGVEKYEDKMSSEKIRNFLDGYIGGRKCDRALILNDKTDLDTLTAVQLKEFLRGVSTRCEGCFEKADYIKKVKEIANSAQI